MESGGVGGLELWGGVREGWSWGWSRGDWGRGIAVRGWESGALELGEWSPGGWGGGLELGGCVGGIGVGVGGSKSGGWSRVDWG